MPDFKTGISVNGAPLADGLGNVLFGRLPVAADGISSAAALVRADDSRLFDGRAPVGPATGDLGGTYPNPTVVGIRGRTIAPYEPLHGQVYWFNSVSAAWEPASLTPTPFAVTIGDGVTTDFVITHSLGTRDVVVSVWETTAPYSAVTVDMEVTDENSVTLHFGLPPSTNAYRVVVAAGGSGGVSRVDMTAPTQFTVSGAPITGSGTIALGWANQTANTVLAGPASGVPGAPSFRSLGAADLPTHQHAWGDLTGTRAAGGDLYSTYPNPMVGKLRGRAISNDSPLHGAVYTWDEDNQVWTPTVPYASWIDSINMELPSIFTHMYANPSDTGNIGFALATQAANLVFAGPTSGAAAAPTFRALVAGDLPANVAYKDVDNVFSVAQGIRVAASGVAAGLHVPWVSGDTLATIRAGATTSGNNQVAVYGQSNSGFGIRGYSASNAGVYAEADSVTALIAKRNAATNGGVNDIVTLRATPSGGATPTTGFGVSFTLQADTNGGANRDQGRIASFWTDVADATRTSALAFYTTNSGSLAERMRLSGAGLLGLSTTEPLYGIHQIGGAMRQQAIGAPTNQSVGRVGTGGTTVYTYYIYAVDRAGRRSIAASVTYGTGNATLSATNYNVISWTAVAGAVSYIVTRNSTTAQIGTTTETFLNDQGQATTAITAPTHDETGDLIVDGWLGVGTTGPLGRLGVVDTGSSANTISALSGQTSAYAAYSLGRAVPEVYFGIVAGAGQFVTPSTAGDAVLVVDSSARKLFLSAGTSPALTVTNTNVGIGTSSPSAKLDVMDGYIRARDGANNPPTSGQGLEFLSSGGTAYIHSFNRDTSSYRPMVIQASTIQMADGATSQTVGIGAVSPGAKLYIRSGHNTNTSDVLQLLANNLTVGFGFSYNTIEMIGTNATNDMYFRSKGTGAIYFQATSGSNGNIGGNFRVDWNGNIVSRGFLYPGNQESYYIGFVSSMLSSGLYVNGGLAIYGPIYPGNQTTQYLSAYTSYIWTSGAFLASGVIYPSNQTSYYLYGDTGNSGLRTNGNFLINGNTWFGNLGLWQSQVFNQALLTTSSPTFGGLTLNGNISCGVITATNGGTFGNTLTNYGDNWTHNLTLNGVDYSSIGFHDAGNRVDVIRVGGGIIELGYNGGWGNPQIKMLGNTAVGRSPYPNIKLEAQGSDSTSSNIAIAAHNSNTSALWYMRNDGYAWVNQNWAVGSDEKLKSQIEPLDTERYGRDKLRMLQPRRYLRKISGHVELGFIAQEVEPVFPDLVSDAGLPGEEPIKAINYNGFIPVLINAHNEQENELERLKDNYAALQEELQAALERIAVLEGGGETPRSTRKRKS